MAGAGKTSPAVGGGGRRVPRARVQAHRNAYALGLAGADETDEIAGDPQLRRSYRKGLRDARGEGTGGMPAKPAGETKSPLEQEADAFAAAHPGGKAPKAPPTFRQTMNLAGSGSGFALGLLATAGALNYFQGGLPQVRRWLAAKFLNRTPAAGGKTS